MSMYGGISPLNQGSPFSWQTAFGPTNDPGGVAYNANLAGPRLGAFGSGAPPGLDPLFGRQPAASSFFLPRLLGFTAGLGTNTIVGPVPANLGLSPGLLGAPYFASGGAPGAGNLYGNPIPGAGRPPRRPSPRPPMYGPPQGRPIYGPPPRQMFPPAYNPWGGMGGGFRSAYQA